MKLNATAEMIPITWPEFSDVHRSRPRPDGRVCGDDFLLKCRFVQNYGF